MRDFAKALKIILISSIVFATTYANAQSYSFLRKLKVGQCITKNGAATGELWLLFKGEKYEKCGQYERISEIGNDYFITVEMVGMNPHYTAVYHIYTAHSIRKISFEP